LGKRILITGIAGFIGFHLAKHLKTLGHLCLGVDNFNSYYDPQLKKDRAAQLTDLSVNVIHADICDTIKLQTLIEDHGITHVVNLAAQAGVRHSLSHPMEYVDSNLRGFTSLLEACKSCPAIKLIYASSSSVYGLNTKTPFSPDDRTDAPANLYGATKKANELMANAYHHIYGISVTGLRFFTVYGPWGRPDMAYYRFSHKICEGEPISIFNHGKMKRDFTYIDDIVKGTVAAIDLGAACDVFNLGNNRPVELLYFIELLEEALGKKAVKNMLPMQAGEVVETFADIEKSQKILGFRPEVSIEEGIRRFTDWFKQYHNLPQTQMRLAENQSDLSLSDNKKF
jgi:UDP-glucuronate 4-epimerase